MEKKTIFTFSALPYRQKIPVDGYYFGGQAKSLAIVGSTRGDEYQQIFVCGLLIQALKRLEEAGDFAGDAGVVVIPSASQFSMNVGKRFWPMDNTDINRMFPGYDQGETTQRLANSIFEEVRSYENGIQLASFYLPGEFVPHVRYMNTGYHKSDDGMAFGLQYLMTREPAPIDTTTLNYNWQVFGTNAFSIYAKSTDRIDPKAARRVVAAILRYMRHKGMLKAELKLPAGRETVKIDGAGLQKKFSGAGGFVHFNLKVGDYVDKGTAVGQIFDPFTAECLEELRAPCSGQLFYVRSEQVAVAEHELMFSVTPIEQVVVI
ncbi:M14 family metallopeptidase [Anaerovibrio sp.]|uniref:M14 family metallopeptidase n=1 Tax=Anaerovibrio sp. TaxID=1872532 RepID=UPI003F14CE9C